MSPRRHIDRLLAEVHKLNVHGHLLFKGDAILKCADVELAIYELQKELEERENYDKDD